MTAARQGGMALGIVMLLLLGLATLAIAGYGAAIAALALAGLEQHAARAFEAAEAGVSRSLRNWRGPEGLPGAVPEPAWPAEWADVTTVATVTPDPAHWAAAWPDGFSVGAGDGTFTTRHYTIVADGRAPRRSAVRIEQGFTVIEPAP